MATIAEEAVQSARELFAMVNRDCAQVLAAAKATVIASRLFEELPRHPVGHGGVSGEAPQDHQTHAPLLEELGILVETSGRKRDRAFGYAQYLDRLRVGTELE